MYNNTQLQISNEDIKKIELLKEVLKKDSESFKKLKTENIKIEQDLKATKREEDEIIEEIESIKNSLKRLKDQTEDLYKIVANLQWKHLKTEITSSNDAVNMGIYYSKMDKHKSSVVISQDVNEVLIKKLNSSSNLTSNNESVIMRRIELEAQAAELNVKKIQYQEGIVNEELQNLMLKKRNAATLIKLSKDLQQSETQRKIIIEKCKELQKNINIK